MLNIKHIVAIIIGARIPTALHRIGRLIGFAVAGEISLRSFFYGLRPNQVTVSSRSGSLLGLDRALDRMFSHAGTDDITILHRGSWHMSQWSLTYCRSIVGRDSDGNFHPGLEFIDTRERVTSQWLAPYVSFAEAWHVSRHAHFQWRRKAHPFAAL